MNHDEKLALVIQAINNTAPEEEGPGICHINLYPTAENKLQQFDDLELFNLIKELGQYVSITILNSPLGTDDARLEISTNKPTTNYFQLFLGEYPLNINFFKELESSLDGLYYPTFLILYDLLLDIEEIYESTERISFTVPLMPKRKRFPEPYETMTERERMAARERAMNFLLQNRVITIEGYKHGQNELETEADMFLRKKLFKRYIDKAKEIYARRSAYSSHAKRNSEIVAEIELNIANEIFLVVKGKKKQQLGHPHHDSENGNVFEFLFGHPNMLFTKKQIEEATNISITKTFYKIVDNLGFTGNIKKAFFKTAKNTIFFRKEITAKQLKELGITNLLVSTKKKSNQNTLKG